MEQRILAIWATWTDKISYMLWDIYPAGREALKNVKKAVNSLEREGRGAEVIVAYQALSEEAGRRHLDYIYETEKGPGELWKELWEEL